jgi:prefoldin subunit 5
MRNPVGFSFFLAAAALLCFGAFVPAVTFAGGGSAKPAASPNPDSQKKVWTNDDVERLNPEFVVGRAPQVGSSSAAAPSIVAVQPVRIATKSIARRAPLDPQQDPLWYGQQVTALDAELSAIDDREEQLREFRATSAGLPTGLVLNAPVEGITTDNLIAQLESRRQEIAQQIDALGDLARQNNLPPGILVEGRGLVQVAGEPSVADQRAVVALLAEDASDQLAQVQGVVAGMQEQLAAQGITLTQPAPGQVGNMTTDLLERLDSRANALQNVISEVDDAARGLGVSPGDLR